MKNDIDKYFVEKDDTVFVLYKGYIIRATFVEKEEETGRYRVRFKTKDGEVKEHSFEECFLREQQGIQWLIKKYYKIIKSLNNRKAEVMHLRVCANCMNCVKRVNNQGEWTKKWSCLVDNHRISNPYQLNTNCKNKTDFTPDWKDDKPFSDEYMP